MDLIESYTAIVVGTGPCPEHEQEYRHYIAPDDWEMESAPCGIVQTVEPYTDAEGFYAERYVEEVAEVTYLIQDIPSNGTWIVWQCPVCIMEFGWPLGPDADPFTGEWESL